MQTLTLFPSQCILAEGPLWHKERNSCFWVGIERGVLYEYGWKTEEVKTWSFDHRVTMVLQAANNEVILALDRRIAFFDLETEKLQWLVELDNQRPNNRCNDGACDSEGRIWVGTMGLDFKEGVASLYCIDKQGEAHRKMENVTISNGLAWSLDNTLLYYIDTPTRKIQSYFYEAATGEISFNKTIIHIPEETGSPDGMAIDSEGMLWIAHYGGFGVYRWNPDTGEFLEKIEVPAPNVTSCAFVGEDLDKLLITTARENLSEEELLQYPESGNVFLAQAKVKGIAPFRHGGSQGVDLSVGPMDGES